MSGAVQLCVVPRAHPEPGVAQGPDARAPPLLRAAQAQESADAGAGPRRPHQAQGGQLQGHGGGQLRLQLNGRRAHARLRDSLETPDAHAQKTRGAERPPFPGAAGPAAARTTLSRSRSPSGRALLAA